MALAGTHPPAMPAVEVVTVQGEDLLVLLVGSEQGRQQLVQAQLLLPLVAHSLGGASQHVLPLTPILTAIRVRIP